MSSEYNSAEGHGKTSAAAQKAQKLHLVYHELSPDPRDYTYVTATQSFAGHLALFARLQNGPLQPVITFDDGHISHYIHALSLLADHQLKATFFITAGWTGTRPDFMGWPELRSLQQAGHAIGAHGWSHALLTHCNATELRTELYDSRRRLEDGLGISITTMSFPGGRFNKRVLQACEEAGYLQMYTSVPSVATEEPQELVGRLNMRAGVTAGWLEDLFSTDGKLLARLQRQERVKAAARKLLGDRLYTKIWALANRHEPATP